MPHRIEHIKDTTPLIAYLLGIFIVWGGVTNYIRRTKSLQKLIDLGHYQPFKGIATYTAISLFRKSNSFDYLEYFIYNGKNLKKIRNIPYSELFTADGKMHISSNSEYRTILSIKTTGKKKIVKNGFATLADKIFINDKFPFNPKFIIDCYKASKGIWKKCIFPYKENGEPYSLEEIRKYDESLYNYLVKHKETLLRRNIKDTNLWYLYGRTQGIKDVYKDKLAINNMAVKTVEDLHVEFIPKGKGVYSGLYILTEGLDVDKLIGWLKSEKFLNFIKSLKNYKSGGYYSFTSGDLEKFIYYMMNYKNAEKVSGNLKKGLFDLFRNQR